MKINMLDRAQALSDEITRLRRDFHQNPELSFNEYRTSAIVADTLQKIGIRTKTGVGRTGVVGEIGPGSGPTIAIRADMDALPIQEENEVPYSSQNDGIMHACGHDAHTAILLGTAYLLQQSFIDEKWQGNVRLLFQPSEEAYDENGIGGASAMIEDGALQDIDVAIALHVWSDYPAGICYFHDGYSLAAVDSFKAWLRAPGGHGAYPHKSKDPIFILAPVLTALYGIPSRRINPLHASVVSLGQVHAGTAPNIIPKEVFLEGTIRSFEPDVREQLIAEVKNALKISEIMGGSYEFELTCGYPSMFNDSEVNGWLRSVSKDIVGEEGIENSEFGMGAEDFAYITQAVKGAMFMLGAAIADGEERKHHTCTFDIDESVLPIGAAILAETARRFVTGRI